MYIPKVENEKIALSIQQFQGFEELDVRNVYELSFITPLAEVDLWEN